MQRHHLVLPPFATSRLNRRMLLGAAMGSLASAAAGPRLSSAQTADTSQVKAVYLNPVALDWAGIEQLLDLIIRTELNAVVVDIKEDGVYSDTEIDLFRSSGSVAPFFDLTGLLNLLHANDIYAIARLVVFRDDYVVAARPDLAVRDSTTGDVWRDYGGLTWINPFAEEYWDAITRLATETAALGFDEVQFDYVRFPSDGDLDRMDFGQPADATTRPRAISSFLGQAQTQLGLTGTAIGTDVFGFTLLIDELGIGQDLTQLAPRVDAICPMVYPSHFPDGSIDVAGHPNDFPAETIAISLEAGRAKLAGNAAQLRPWLQDFTLPGMTEYGPVEVRAQIDAAEAAGAGGWMIWNAASIYHEAAFNLR